MNAVRLNKLLEMSLTPMAEQPPIDRDELGPMVEGYCSEMLTTCGYSDYGISDISERLLAQMIRDCVYFYNFNRTILDPLYKLKEYSDRKCGKDFWRERNNLGRGFTNRGFEDFWDELAQGTKRWKAQIDEIYENAGIIDVGEDPWG